jgi:hypothetical protein
VLVLEELYDVFSEAEPEMARKGRHQTLSAGSSRSTRILRRVVGNRLRDFHPAAYDRIARGGMTEAEDEDGAGDEE